MYSLQMGAVKKGSAASAQAVWQAQHRHQGTSVCYEQLAHIDNQVRRDSDSSASKTKRRKWPLGLQAHPDVERSAAHDGSSLYSRCHISIRLLIFFRHHCLVVYLLILVCHAVGKRQISDCHSVTKKRLSLAAGRSRTVRHPAEHTPSQTYHYLFLHYSMSWWHHCARLGVGTADSPSTPLHRAEISGHSSRSLQRETNTLRAPVLLQSKGMLKAFLMGFTAE